MKKIAKIISLLVLIVSTNYTQTSWDNQWGPFGGTINALAEKDGRIFAGTDYNVYYTDNYYELWLSSLNINTTINAILPLPGAIIAATAGRVFVSTGNGDNWTSYSVDPANSSTRALVKNSSGVVFAATLGGGVFRSYDNGMSWSSCNAGLTGQALVVRSLGININNILFAGTTAGMYRSTTGGETWELANTGMVTTDTYSILAIGDSTILTGQGASVYRSTDTGNSWQKVYQMSVMGRVFDVKRSSSGAFFAATDYGLFKSADNCASWSEVIIPAPSKVVNCILPLTGKLYVGLRGGVFCSLDDGATWISADKGIASTSVQAIKSLPSGKILCGTYQSGLYVLPRNGNIWEQRDEAESISCFDYDDNAIYAGSQSTGMYKSTDSGATWKVINNGIYAKSINSVLVDDSSFVLCGGVSYGSFVGGGVYKTSNGGESWSNIYVGPSGSAFRSLIKGNAGAIIAATSLGVQKSTNGGYTWALSNSGIPVQDVKVVFKKGTDLYAGTNAGIYKSVDNGATWTGVLPISQTITSFTSDGQGYIYAAESLPAILRSTDNGANWEILNNESKYCRSNCLAIDAAGVLYTGTNGYGVFRFKLTGVEDDLNRPSSFALEQNFPNPFNPETKIKYSIPASGVVKLKVLNALGKEVAVLVNGWQSAGAHEIRFNGNNLPSGIYFYNLTSGQINHTRKMILLK